MGSADELQRLIGLDSGQYSVRFAKDGFYDYRTDVFIDPGDTVSVRALMEKKPSEWYEEWWFWTLVVGAATGAVVGTVLGTRSGPDDSNLDVQLPR